MYYCTTHMFGRADIRIKPINIGIRVMTKNMLEVYENMCYKISKIRPEFNAFYY